MYFSLYWFILVLFWSKQFLFINVNHARIPSWSQPVLRNEGNISCSRKQRESFMGLELTTDQLPSRRASHCDNELYNSACSHSFFRKQHFNFSPFVVGGINIDDWDTALAIESCANTILIWPVCLVNIKI